MAAEPIVPLGSFESQVDWGTPRVDDGQLIFARYDRSRNNKEIVALGLDGTSPIELIPGRPEARFVARTGSYLVVNERGRFTTTLVAIDKASSKEEGRVGLRYPIEWARVEGNRIFAFQRGGDGLVLDFPSMKVKSAVALPGRLMATSWSTNVVVVGSSLSVYNNQWELVAALPLGR